ncbi:MAG: tRNA (guanosine(37)-N1)-methyltransferase TrmD [Chloroflexi bacterium]|nr:tRNA (guanosine(37)-N1)-methyltransferase TrmD [Chloroflexota bacterium]MBI3761046.1 tRNA (guanosine(37)-N1)-methyltransferase TrmD [Chloroflexota bacterium]
MRIDIFTLFPAMFESPLQESILKRAQESGQLTVAIHNIRDYATDKHHVTDDTPYGGGGGMVMKAEPVFAAVEAVLELQIPNSKSQTPNEQTPIILLTPQGRLFTQNVAQELAQYERIALICGRYEGVDERVRAGLATDEISIGDFVVTGGELPAMIVVDAVTRLLPGVLGDPGAAADDSHATGLLEYPHYTRPPEFRGLRAPDVLLSGDHAKVERWRREQALRRTWQRRPDLLLTAELSEADREYLAILAEESAASD